MDNSMKVREKENGFIRQNIRQNEYIKENIAAYNDFKQELLVEIINSFAENLFANFLETNYLLFVDILHIFVKSWVIPRIHNCISLANQSIQMKCVEIIDATNVKPGDVLYTSSFNYMIVKNILSDSRFHRDDRLSVELVHTACNGYLTTKRVSKDTFSVLPGKSVINIVSSKNRKLVSTIASQEVGDVISSRSFSRIELLKNAGYNHPLKIWSRPIYKPQDIMPGNIITFLNHGFIKSGVVLKKRFNPNNVLTISHYNVSKDGIVSEDTTTFDLDEVAIKKCVYLDLDAVVRKRLLHIAEQMKGRHIQPHLMTNSFAFVSSCLSGDIVFSTQLPIFIGLQHLQLSTKAFPRIQNIETWMNKHSCLEVSDQVTNLIESVVLTTSVLLLASTNSTPDKVTYFKEEEIIKMNTEIYSSRDTALERVKSITENMSKNIVCVIELHPDQDGSLHRIDRDILVFMKHILNEKDTVYSIPNKSGNDVRLMVSKAVREIVFPKDTLNKVFSSIFYESDPDIQKRISLCVERQVTKQIWQYSKNLDKLKTSAVGSVKDEIDRLRQTIEKLKSFSCNNKPDMVDRHIIEVLLQRHENAPAFSIKEGKMNILTNDMESVQEYLKRFLPTNTLEMVQYKEWPGKPKIMKCHFQQGNKVIRSIEKPQEYGTLGFFLRDDYGNIYFTTCAHVIGKGQNAYTETENEIKTIGKSVYSPAEECLSITEKLDLSIVQVIEDKIESCGFGLRNHQDMLVHGSVSVAESSEMEDMKVYKWGAKTQLTKGIYKGSVFVKKGEKFDSYLHYIQGSINKKEFAQEGDSGSLICFEATESPQFQNDTAAFIFVGECQSGDEYLSGESFTGSCYHVDEVFRCKIEHLDGSLQPHLTPTTENSPMQAGAAVFP